MPKVWVHCNYCNKDFYDYLYMDTDEENLKCPHCKSGIFHLVISTQEPTKEDVFGYTKD